MTEYIDVYYQLPKDFKPIYNDDGSIDFPVVLTSSNPDKENDVVDTMSLIVTEATFGGYNHYKCGGTKVQTGARPLLDTLKKTKEIATIYMRIHPTDEMFFCEVGSLKKQSNGKLIDAVKMGHVSGVSIGYRFDPKKVIRKKSICYYYDVIVQEISILDIAPMNYNSTIINKSTMLTENEKNKCIQCMLDAGVGTVLVNPDNIFVKITEITPDNIIKGMTFEGTEMIIDESYEIVTYQAPMVMDKACSCMTGKKAVETIPAMPRVTMDEFMQLKDELKKLSDMVYSMSEKNKAVTSQTINDLITDAVNIRMANSFTAQPINTKPITKSLHPNI